MKLIVEIEATLTNTQLEKIGKMSDVDKSKWLNNLEETTQKDFKEFTKTKVKANFTDVK